MTCLAPALAQPRTAPLRAAARRALLATLCLASCVTPLPAQQPTSTGLTVHGTVLNSATHQPVAHALVTLDHLNQAILTDNQGRFSFADIPAGQQSLSCQRPGFAGLGNNSPIVRQEFTVAADLPDLTLELVPQSAITGELVQPGDDSPDTLRVNLLHQQIQNGRATWQFLKSTTASSEGHFRFGNLQPGSYIVQVASSLDPAPAETGRLRYGYPPVFYPNAREMAGAGVLTLAPGQQAQARLPLAREPFYPVRVPVNDPGEARGLSFQVNSDSFLGLPGRLFPSDGTVHLDLPIGHYTLQASGGNRSPLVGTREFDVHPRQQPGPNMPVTPIVVPPIALLQGSRIPVTVHADFTHDARPDPETPRTALSQIDLELEPLVGAMRRNRSRMQDDPGSASTGISYLVNVAPGRYWVHARPYEGYVASLTSAGDNLLEQPLTVAADGSAPPVLVTLRDDNATISATLAASLQTAQSAQPLKQSIYLQLLPLSGTASEMTSLFQPDGTPTVVRVAPGGYLAIASSTQQEIEYRNPKVMANLAARGQAVTVEPGGTAQVALSVLLDPGQP
ncbi:MAG TPA: carboxypeptidase-like regulatory domain-containing protein [Acidobacteriaceae bacterium]